MLNLILSKARFVRIAHSHTPGKMKFQHQGRILVGCHIAASPVDVSSDFSEFAVKAEFSSRRVGSGLGRGEGFFIVVMSVSPAIRLSYLAATRPLLAPTLTASTCARAAPRPSPLNRILSQTGSVVVGAALDNNDTRKLIFFFSSAFSSFPY